jgi:uncharacterized protein with von Willebrand factor type A (vWA) domain
MEKKFSQQFEANLKKDNQDFSDKNRWLKGEFSDIEKEEIDKKRKLLSTLAYFIGKDFKMPVEINTPGQGWHWDFAENVVRIDPIDLLEKPIDYLRFVISHEGGHRRISRTEFIPLETWEQPGFPFLMNAIEDPRDNNFVAENYPKFKEQMELAYNHDLDLENKTKERAKEKLGYQPRHIQAGFEYIKQWFREVQDRGEEISSDLPEEVQEVIKKTLKFARDSWWSYPSKNEADESEHLIKRYAKNSYNINLNKIWPEFKKLIDQDLEDQKMQEFLKDMQTKKGQSQESESGGEQDGQDGQPNNLSDKLNKDEQKELEEAIKKALGAENDENPNENSSENPSENPEDKQDEDKQGEGDQDQDGQGKDGSGRPIDLDRLSEELKQKIKEYLESLPEDKKKDLDQRAKQELQGFNEEVAKELAGKISDDPQQKKEREDLAKDQPQEKDDSKDEEKKEGEQKDNGEFKGENLEEKNLKIRSKELKREAEKVRDKIGELLNKDGNAYETSRREILPVINRLETDLREIFVRRRSNKWQSGFRIGKKIDLSKRMQEKAKGVSAVDSRAWEKREAPTEKDYAITLLIDLSGSMEGAKINEAFKSTIILSEVLNRLSIKVEILGFNDRLYEYQNYGQNISQEVRDNMGGMLKEVSNRNGGRALYNDDGWALKVASERLNRQNVKEKILIVLSDGFPEPSPAHKNDNYELSQIVKEISENTNQKLIGLGILSDAVKNYYPDNLPNIKAEDLGKELARKIRAVIENDDRRKGN